MASQEIGAQAPPEEELQVEPGLTEEQQMGLSCLRAIQIPGLKRGTLPPGIERVAEERKGEELSAAYGFQSKF